MTETGGSGRARQRGWRWTLAILIAAAALALIPAVRYLCGAGWDSNAMLATYILVGTVLAAEAGVLILLKTARTRYSVERKIREHPEVNEYVILWNRPRWILFTPSVVAALLFGSMLWLREWRALPEAVTPQLLGGIWVVLCILNVLVEQFHMSIKVVFIVLPTIGALLLVLNLVGYADEAIRLLRYAAVNVPVKLYFI
ncbi:MAG: hypothetical protein PVJ27_10260, partial [Candidatus Brocadiaceae bacterium]